MYCPKCGNKVEDNQNFCDKCGTKLSDSTDKITNSIDKTTNNKRWEKILIFSVIGFTASIMLGNVFNAIDFDIGKYLAMILLCISSGSGIISLIGYFISKKGNTDKVPTWIIVIVGIIIAVVIANIISKAIDTSRMRTEELNMQKAADNLRNNTEKTYVDKVLDDMNNSMHK